MLDNKFYLEVYQSVSFFNYYIYCFYIIDDLKN
jgi:hypothetical protein